MKAKREKELDFCFTIMPYGNWFDTYYQKIYYPAIEEVGLKSTRADDLYRPSSIVHDIWQYTKDCKIVLADLTGKNPNVLYELGLAHAIGKPVILIVETMEDIPYDLRALRIIEYDKNAYNWGDLLRKKIVNALKEVILSPIKAVPHAFLDAIKFPEHNALVQTKENTTEKLSPEFTNSITVIIVLERTITLKFAYDSFNTIQSFFDTLWFKLNDYVQVEAYTYGKSWKLINKKTSYSITKLDSVEKNAKDYLLIDDRNLDEASIYRGDLLEVLFL